MPCRLGKANVVPTSSLKTLEQKYNFHLQFSDNQHRSWHTVCLHGLVDSYRVHIQFLHCGEVAHPSKECPQRQRKTQSGRAASIRANMSGAKNVSTVAPRTPKNSTSHRQPSTTKSANPETVRRRFIKRTEPMDVTMANYESFIGGSGDIILLQLAPSST